MISAHRHRIERRISECCAAAIDHYSANSRYSRKISLSLRFEVQEYISLARMSSVLLRAKLRLASAIHHRAEECRRVRQSTTTSNLCVPYRSYIRLHLNLMGELCLRDALIGCHSCKTERRKECKECLSSNLIEYSSRKLGNCPRRPNALYVAIRLQDATPSYGTSSQI